MDNSYKPLGDDRHGSSFKLDEPMLAPGLLDPSLLAAQTVNNDSININQTAPILNTRTTQSSSISSTTPYKTRQRTVSGVQRRTSLLYNDQINEAPQVSRARLDSAFAYEIETDKWCTSLTD